jgi:hypothetical protein
MTGLAQLLAEPARLFSRVKAKAPEPVALRRAVSKLNRPTSEREVEQTAAIQARIADAAQSGTLAQLSRRTLREGCKVFLHPPAAPGRDPEVRDGLVDEVDRLKRRSAFFALLDAYLDAFDAEDRDVVRLGGRLSTLIAHWPWRETDLWPEKAKTYALFDASEAPIRIFQAVLSSDATPRAVLASAGLDTDGRRRGGLAEAAFRLACRFVQSQTGMPALTPQLKLLDWAEIRADFIGFPGSWSDFASSLFLPWRGAEPPGDHKRLIVDAVIGFAGDPRVREARWRPIRQANGEAYDVILRWLTKASVEQFFDIVSETMNHRPDMWAERRKFWTAYLRADLISSAWVAFGADGAWRADQAASRSTDKGLSMFGRLASGGGRTAEHAALIMRIGDLTVVEWSHNGRWNIWCRGDKAHPALFRHNERNRPDYDPHELMYAPTGGSHVGNWRWKVADIIRRQTGLRP